MMDYAQFITRVQHLGNFDSRSRAENAARVTLEALGQRITPEERKHLMRYLPPQIASFLKERRGPERFGLDEFFRIEAEREGVNFENAVHDARAVMAALEENAPAEVKHVLVQLSQDFGQLFEAGHELSRTKPR